jgi:hypothetical protein
MNPQLNSQMAQYRIDDMLAVADARRLARAARGARRSPFVTLARRGNAPKAGRLPAEWWGAAAAGRGLPA